MSLIEAAIGWLAPPTCIGCGQEGSVLCEGCGAAEVTPFGVKCWRCGALSERAKTCKRCYRPGSPRHVWVTTDYEGLSKELIRIYKFGHLRAAAGPLTAMMAETFLSHNSDEEIQKANYLIVPIPTATSRIRQRGFGHAELLAASLSKKLKLEHKSSLRRLGQQRQVGSRRAQRLKQSEGNYYLPNPESVAGRHILLVDDVITTGATLQTSTSVLKQSGTKRVDALVFAKRL